MKLKSNLHFTTLLIILLFLELYFASHMYDYDSKVLINNEIFNLNREKENLRVRWQKNIENSTYTLTDDLLYLYCERGDMDWDKAIFSVNTYTSIPLKRGLMIQYSIFPSQLNLKTDAAYVELFLANGSNLITLLYVVGFKEQNRVPDIMYPQYSYVIYQVGNATAQFKGQRNVWSDLTRENLSLTEYSWVVTSTSFGVISYQAEDETQNHKMAASFNLYENSLYYENLTLVWVEPNTKVSYFMATVIIMCILLFFLMHKWFQGHKFKEHQFTSKLYETSRSLFRDLARALATYTRYEEFKAKLSRLDLIYNNLYEQIHFAS